MKHNTTTKKAISLIGLHGSIKGLKTFKLIYISCFLLFFVIILGAIALFYEGGLFINLTQDGNPYWTNSTTKWNAWIICGVILIFFNFIYAILILIWYLPFVYLKSKEIYMKSEEYKIKCESIQALDLSCFSKSQLKWLCKARWLSKQQYHIVLENKRKWKKH